MDNFYLYWGKSQKAAQASGDLYHLLPYHSLDVAACGYWLVKGNYFGVGSLLAQLGLTGDEAALWFAWLLGWHDIGKFGRSFQQIVIHPELVPPLADKNTKTHHSALGFWIWQKKLRAECKQQTWSLFATPLTRHELGTLDLLIAMVTGHHGTPPNEQVEGINSVHADDIVAVQHWLTALTQLLGRTALPARWSDTEWRKKTLRSVSWPLAGVVVLADWLGSNQNDFPYCNQSIPLSTYWAQALQRAETALRRLPTVALSAPFTAITDLFPFITQPTPLQQCAIDLPLATQGAELFILEDVTGAGKTEAALTLAHRLMGQGRASGLYVGLPTMATANAMFSRLRKAYRRLFESYSNPSLVLAHGARELNTDFTHSIWDAKPQAGAPYYSQPQEQTASADCNHWFADSRKKALLADVGVGTLDQALMAVLPFRHQSLRMLGLHHKVLLLDEVHAYDGYMLCLLERLLAFHASQGGCAIILSATLSQHQRQALVAAFARGAAQPVPALSKPDEYPLLTQFGRAVWREEPVATREQVRRCVAVNWLHGEDACIAQVVAAVQQGQCIAWVRNTVDDAIAAYKALSTLIDSEHLSLFHSRFAFADRLAIETQTLQRFGDDSTSVQRRGQVLVATQVIEQSLDLDFDLLISDLAPIDLLIQRAGRLQRHIRDASGKRDRVLGARDGRVSPMLMVHAPCWSDTPEVNWVRAALPGSSAVYQDHGCLWLTQSVLREQGQIRMPEQARLLVESVYGEQAMPPAQLQTSSDNAEGQRLSERATALQLLLKLESGYSINASDRWQKHEELSTRLSEPTVTLYLAHAVNGDVQPYASEPFAWEMSALKVREKLWLQVKDHIPHLTDAARVRVLEQHRLYGGEVVVLPVALSTCAFYCRCFGFQLQGES